MAVSPDLAAHPVRAFLSKLQMGILLHCTPTKLFFLKKLIFESFFRKFLLLRQFLRELEPDSEVSFGNTWNWRFIFGLFGHLI
jgi:hypothetical protein